jgi:hypothetical protein
MHRIKKILKRMKFQEVVKNRILRRLFKHFILKVFCPERCQHAFASFCEPGWGGPNHCYGLKMAPLRFGLWVSCRSPCYTVSYGFFIT